MQQRDMDVQLATVLENEELVILEVVPKGIKDDKVFPGLKQPATEQRDKLHEGTLGIEGFDLRDEEGKQIPQEAILIKSVTAVGQQG